MVHLTNFSFEFFYKIFTEDASLPLLYHGAKKSKMTKNSNQRGGGGGPALTPKLLEIEKEIVREVARGDKPYLRKSTDRKAQIRNSFVQFSGLICALRSVDFSLVFRVVQGEAKTPKIMGCCRAIFAFLHARKIGTFR